MSPHDDFKTDGFLSSTITNAAPYRRLENCEYFTLAEDTNSVLMRIVDTAIKHSDVRNSNWSPEALAIRLLMRSLTTLQGVIVLAERGMIVQARTLARTIVEDSFFSAALTTQPNDVVRMFREGAEASRRAQGQFIIAQQLGNSDLDRQKLQTAIDAIDRNLSFLKPKKVAEMSSMLPQYLNYMRLSDDSSHTSATSLHKHVGTFEDGPGWNYKMDPGSREEIASTLHRALLAVMPVGIVVTQMLPDSDGYLAVLALADRLQTLPDGMTI